MGPYCTATWEKSLRTPSFNGISTFKTVKDSKAFKKKTNRSPSKNQQNEHNLFRNGKKKREDIHFLDY